MASYQRNKTNGTTKIEFYLDKQKHRIHFSKLSEREAMRISDKIGQLIHFKRLNQTPDGDLTNWLAGLDDVTYEKLVRQSLVPARERYATGLKDYLDSYINGRHNLKPATRTSCGLVISDLIQYFGESRNIQDINAGEAEDFRQNLIKRGLSASTISKRLQRAKMFFAMALKKKIISENPFDGVSHAATVKTDRMFFVTREMTDLILEQCDLDWMLIIALGRFGGVRVPSECLFARWQDVDWERQRMLIHSPKTEHHQNQACREIPLFPELKVILERAYEAAEVGQEFIIRNDEYRLRAKGKNGWQNVNLRTQFERMIKRAGLTPWPRLFHALRSSRETELVKDYPIHTVTKWLGNSPKIALKHYLVVTDDDFQKACSVSTNRGIKLGGNSAERGGNVPQAVQYANKNTPDLQGFAEDCCPVLSEHMAGTGLEAITQNPLKRRLKPTSTSNQGDKVCTVANLHVPQFNSELRVNDRPYDAVLEKLIQHWHSLPNEARLLIGDIVDDHVDSEI